ncbi:MAG: ATP-binding cassette domain-containing protein [Acidimicrobiia bacterium]|nr:ATP-binding cassette domain-containing protein [Acidimicrobiia bacterium]MBJ7381075.1 ATP-binding cassette domain-containing protein [Acidimicrobiia bacterium]MBJ7513201.1 ATP-binding cassette domain-containing protein [Acidimicrobiia bacterium]
MTSSAIRTEGLVRRFGETTAVDGVDIEVPRGEIYGFLGPNGAGKSTLMRMLVTLLLPTAGTAEVAGFNVVTDPDTVRLHIGVALQDASLDSKQTGLEILKLQARLYGLNKNETESRLKVLSGLIDLGEALDRRVGTYSGGMKRRLDLAAALVHNPDVLFLDEPTTGLDPVSRAVVWGEVRRLNEELGMTIFLTTQYLEEADELAHRVGIIDAGKIVAEGTPEALKRGVGNDVIVAEVDPAQGELAVTSLASIGAIDSVEAHAGEITVRTENGSALLSPVAVALAEVGVSVKSLTLRTPTLDDVFLQMTGSHIESEATVKDSK